MSMLKLMQELLAWWHRTKGSVGQPFMCSLVYIKGLLKKFWWVKVQYRSLRRLSYKLYMWTREAIVNRRVSFLLTQHGSPSSGMICRFLLFVPDFSSLDQTIYFPCAWLIHPLWCAFNIILIIYVNAGKDKYYSKCNCMIILFIIKNICYLQIIKKNTLFTH